MERKLVQQVLKVLNTLTKFLRTEIATKNTENTKQQS